MAKAWPVAMVIVLASVSALTSAFAIDADHRGEPLYRIRPGDSLDVRFTLTPEFDHTATVRPDGYITLRGREDLQAAGLTTSELKQRLQEVYAPMLRQPLITVDLKDFERSYFTALGEVGKPGKYELRGDTTVTQALAMAGGFSDEARHSQVLLFRRASAEWLEVKKLDVKSMFGKADMSGDVLLRPEDMLFVPKSRLSAIRALIPRVGLGFYVRPAF